MDALGPLIDRIDAWLPGFGASAPLILPLIIVIVVFMLLRRVPVIGPILGVLSWVFVLFALAAAVTQRGRFDPEFAQLISRVTGEDQRVQGKETRVPMARDGHFWAKVSLNGVERRMLVDSGATVTAISTQTASEAGVETGGLPVVIRTANGAMSASQGNVETLRIGNVQAGDVGVVVSPALGGIDVLGMNFLSRLKSWRVEGRTLILVPHHPQDTAA